MPILDKKTPEIPTFRPRMFEQNAAHEIASADIDKPRQTQIRQVDLADVQRAQRALLAHHAHLVRNLGQLDAQLSSVASTLHRLESLEVLFRSFAARPSPTLYDHGRNFL